VGTYDAPYFGARITAVTMGGLFLVNDKGSIVFENPTGGKSESYCLYSVVFSVFIMFFSRFQLQVFYLFLGFNKNTPKLIIISNYVHELLN
jgi:hypothetical protein